MSGASEQANRQYFSLDSWLFWTVAHYSFSHTFAYGFSNTFAFCSCPTMVSATHFPFVTHNFLRRCPSIVPAIHLAFVNDPLLFQQCICLLLMPHCGFSNTYGFCYTLKQFLKRRPTCLDFTDSLSVASPSQSANL